MITNKQKAWLQGFVEGTRTKRDDPHKWSVYRKRIRERIEHMLDNGVWLANNMPEILRDEEWEIQELGAIRRKRLKMLLVMIHAMYPDLVPRLMRIEEDVDLNPYL